MEECENKKKKVSNIIKSKCIFDNLKGDYFLQKVFNNLQEKKRLKVPKYNKKTKNRLNITNNTYKVYCDIEIEIIPSKDKYGKFINIKDEDKLYYHIYFNDEKEEIKRNNINKGDNIGKIKLIIDYQVISFEELFFYCSCIESIYFKKFYRNNIINMNRMFDSCTLLKEINFSNFNTSNVTNMSKMFNLCTSLKEIDLSNFNTSNVTNMNGMFNLCKSLEKLNLSNMNMNNVTNMSKMFYWCSSLKEINLSNCNTGNVTDMSRMFYNCSSLKEINLSNFNTNNVTNMSDMFY